MVYTVTFNPAVDYVVRCGEVRTGAVNRTESEFICFGGKGINVSQVLAQLGVPSRALGFVAGFTGAAIEQGLRGDGIETDFVHIEDGFSRINVKIKGTEETEINGQGPVIEERHLERLYERLDGIAEGDTLVLAGSVPRSVPADIYERILARLSGRSIRTAVDASGELLTSVLKYRPWLIKPNSHELSEIFGRELRTADEIAEHAQRLRGMGARNVLVSMAGDGAVLVGEDGTVHTCGVCSGKVKNSVGAGDSMVAGFIAGFDRGGDHALKLGTACGGATAFSDGLARREDIDRLLEQL